MKEGSKRALMFVPVLLVMGIIAYAAGLYEHDSLASSNEAIDRATQERVKQAVKTVETEAQKAAAVEKAKVAIVPVAIEPAVPMVLRTEAGEKHVVVNLYHDKHQKQMLICYEGEKEVFRFPISGAVTDFDATARNPDTPHNHLGDFRVFKKQVDYWSKDNHCEMPNSVFYWGGHAIHACQPGDIKRLGSPASHGCTRVSPYASEKIYQWARIGTKVKCIREKW